MTVKVWQEKVIIPTYPVGEADKNPMFFEKRVYQGSSGVVYPHPVIEKIADEKIDQEYNGLFLENKYLKIMILPEIGGRVQMAYDKIADRHFIYYNQVIKPALVGLCGPWISGGIEFNWPQHHRPSTFEPVDYRIEENEDGSKTVWVSEVEKMFRTKGMAGFTLHPDKAYLEIKAQLYNRTSVPQTFLWWANPAVSVGDHYQSVFPPDVNAVFDHGKRDVSTFPVATGTYYKVDYSPGTDISRYKNIPVPTSYMAVNSEYDFVGGYEHDTEAGVLHVADHHVSPGKKQWTWGNGDFGVAWDRNLTDEDGPYIELMTGMFTDNQPDFSWLMPYEEKSFTQYFLPYRKVGLVKNASKDILLGLEKEDGGLKVTVFATSPVEGAGIVLANAERVISRWKVSLSPEDVFIENVAGFADPDQLSLTVYDHTGKELISYHESNEHRELPEAAKPARAPEQVASAEQLFLTGQHLEQYRHATYSPVPYYKEALKRDPGDVRNNNALGLWLLRKGQFKEAIPYFEKAVETITQRNPNPYDGEPYYNLGLALSYTGDDKKAYSAYFKSTWNAAWQDVAYFAVAQIDLKNRQYERALEHINWSIDRNARNGKAYMIKARAQRMLSRLQASIETCRYALQRDGFNLSAWYELYLGLQAAASTNEAPAALTQLRELSRGQSHTLIEYAIDYANAGLYDDAIQLLALVENRPESDPMLCYYLAQYHYLSGNVVKADEYLKTGALANPDYCFPNRLEDIAVLQFAISKNPADAKAPYYLGNLWYDKRQYQHAIDNWQRSAGADATFPTVFRNLAIAAYNKQSDPAKALLHFEKAFSLNPGDARVLMELDQLYKKLNYSAQTRLEFLTRHSDVAGLRDDLYLETITLKNFIGEHETAYRQLMERKFHPWEGGEGKVSGQYIYSLTELAKTDLLNGNYTGAIEKLNAAQAYPDNLGEGKLPGAQENDIFYWLGCTYEKLGETEKAKTFWSAATQGLSEPSAAVFYNDQQPDKIFYQGLAWHKLQHAETAKTIFNNLLNYGLDHGQDEVRIDYFAVSLPDLLIFEDDLNQRNKIHCRYIAGLGYLGLNQFDEAQAAFVEVLKQDACHFGALTHLRQLREFNDQGSGIPMS
jgi:tetratricopeptide (TPR) repeat protein